MSEIAPGARCIAFILVPLLASCASDKHTSCQSALNAVTTAELYFGRAIHGEGEVSDAQWQRFLAEEVTPRFPDGFSVSENDGQWRGADGKIVRERSMKLFIILSGKAGEEGDIEAVRSRYKDRFKQDSVLLIEDRACAGF